jgi:hypothetical protein
MGDSGSRVLKLMITDLHGAVIFDGPIEEWKAGG